MEVGGLWTHRSWILSAQAVRGCWLHRESPTAWLAARRCPTIRNRDDGFDAALTVALWHDSYLHEHRREAQASHPAFFALETLGNAWVSRELATILVQRRHDERAGTVSRTLADSKMAFAKHVAEHERWVADWGGYGASWLSASRLGSGTGSSIRSPDCLPWLGRRPVCGTIWGNTLARVVGDANATDWGTLLHLASPRSTVDWSFVDSGPDHQRSFVSGMESTSLSPFLRRYAAAMLVRLPTSIAFRRLWF